MPPTLGTFLQSTIWLIGKSFLASLPLLIFRPLLIYLRYNVGGPHIEKDEAKAFQLYKEAADKGHVPSCHNLSIAYLLGRLEGARRDEFQNRVASTNTHE